MRLGCSEIDSDFATAAQEIWTKRGLSVIRDDFTRIVATNSLPARPNLILANPPYVRHHHLSRDEKARLVAEELDPGLPSVCPRTCPYLQTCHPREQGHVEGLRNPILANLTELAATDVVAVP